MTFHYITLADNTTLDTTGKDILHTRSNMQDSVDQVSNWCDNNHNYGHQSDQDQVYDNLYQIETPAVSLPFDLVPRGAKIDQVSEHRLLGITRDSKLGRTDTY